MPAAPARPTERELLAYGLELGRKVLAAERARAGRAAERFLFAPQHAFIRDQARYRTAVCSRRAGKSVAVASDLLDLHHDAPSLYLTLTRGSGKRILWGTLLKLNRDWSLGFEPNETELVLKRGGEGKVFLAGVDNASEIEKLRGVGWGKVRCDEAQALPGYIKDLVEDVIEPSLMDHQGSLALIGTPGPVPVGFFHECAHSPRWSHHGWTVFDNPHIPNARAYLDEVLARRGVTEDDPGIRREFYGEWAFDPSALVFKYDRARNAFAALPEVVAPWRHVVGVDLGYDDADAIAVLAFSSSSPAAYVVEEWTGDKQTITDLAARLRDVRDRYHPQAIVIDTGGLGKKIAAEITQRTGLALIPAEKERKAEHIELVNDGLRSGRLFARADGPFARDAMLLEWDRSNPERPVVSDKFHSDIADCVLYAYRWSRHWQHQAPVAGPRAGSPEQHAVQEAEHLAVLEREIEERRAEQASMHAWEQGW